MNEPLERTIRVRCSVEHAFSVFTGRVDLWWPLNHRTLSASQLTMEPRVGGRFYERAEGGEEAELGEIVRWDPPHRVTYTWRPGTMAGPTEVDVRFAREGELTVVDVTHSEGRSELGEAWTERVKKFARAWSEVLPALSAYLQAHPERGA